MAVCVVVAALLLVACGAEPPGQASRLFLAGDGELWVVDIDAERARRVELPQLSPGDPPDRIVRRGGRLVLFGDHTYVAGPRLDGLRPLVEDSSFFLPSAHDDRVWVAFLEPTGRGVRAMREVALDGRVTVPDTRPPGGRWPAGAVEDGLLLGTRDGGLLVWNPATRNIVRRLPAADYGPAAGNTVVSCHDPCGGLTITDVGTGETRTLPASRDHLFEPWSGHFSPDGDVLAMPVRASRDMQDRHLALVNIRSGRATIVEGSRVPPTFTFVAWSHSGEHVFLTGGERFGTRVLVAYRLGDPRAEVIDVEVGDFYDVAAM